jgi:hypothetical protein
MTLSSDDPWLTHLPLLHRILAGGEPPSAYPPAPHGDAIHGTCAYWEPLYYLLNTILGWRDLGRGSHSGIRTADRLRIRDSD